MARRILILPSPLLGPTAYRPLAEALGAEVATLPRQPFSPAEVLEAYAAQVRQLEATVLVPHSNAGLFAAVLAAEPPIDAVVHVDAALPGRDGGPTPLAPEPFAATATALAGPDGRLPPWTAWWPREEVEPLFPSPDWFDRVDTAAPRLPAAYLTDTLPCPADWTERPAAYLALSEAYAAELALASELGWPVERLDADHLAVLSRPADVAATVLRLLDTLLSDAPPDRLPDADAAH